MGKVIGMNDRSEKDRTVEEPRGACLSAFRPRASGKRGARHGVFFSISVLLFCVSLLSFALFLSEQSTKSKSTAAALVDMDRTTGTYANVEYELAQVISPLINISVENTTVNVAEEVPLPSQMATAIDQFSQFETQFSDMNITMNLTNLKQGNFVIRPGEIAITNTAGNFSVIPPNSAQGSGAVQSYYVELTMPSNSFNAANWQSASNASTNNMSVHVMVHDPGYASIINVYGSLNKSGTSVLNITSAGTQVALITFYPPAAMKAEYGPSIGLKTSVGLSSFVRVETNDTIGVWSSANKSGAPRIA